MEKAQWLSASLVSVFLSLQTARAEPAILLDLESLDEDHDGSISAEEFERGALARWADDDLDGDGKVTRVELESKFGPVASSMEPQIVMPDDLDRDGAITRDEALAAARMLLRHLDTDGDGWIRADELAQRRQLIGGGPIVMAR